MQNVKCTLSAWHRQMRPCIQPPIWVLKMVWWCSRVLKCSQMLMVWLLCLTKWTVCNVLLKMKVKLKTEAEIEGWKLCGFDLWMTGLYCQLWMLKRVHLEFLQKVCVCEHTVFHMCVWEHFICVCESISVVCVWAYSFSYVCVRAFHMCVWEHFSCVCERIVFQ